jgi:hypothetical protein
LSPDVLAEDHLPRFGCFLHTRGCVDSIAIEVAVGVHRDIRDMNADP